MLLCPVIMAVDGPIVTVVTVMLAAGIAVVPERHALTRSDRRHALERNRKSEQNNNKHAQDSAGHRKHCTPTSARPAPKLGAALGTRVHDQPPFIDAAQPEHFRHGNVKRLTLPPWECSS